MAFFQASVKSESSRITIHGTASDRVGDKDSNLKL